MFSFTTFHIHLFVCLFFFSFFAWLSHHQSVISCYFLSLHLSPSNFSYLSCHAFALISQSHSYSPLPSSLPSIMSLLVHPVCVPRLTSLTITHPRMTSPSLARAWPLLHSLAPDLSSTHSRLTPIPLSVPDLSSTHPCMTDCLTDALDAVTGAGDVLLHLRPCGPQHRPLRCHHTPHELLRKLWVPVYF